MNLTYVLPIAVVALLSLAWHLLQRQLSRPKPNARGELESPPIAKWLAAHRFAVAGFGWGAFMYIAMTVTPVIVGVAGGKGFDGTRLLLGLPVWAVAGLLFGTIMSLWFRRSLKRLAAKESPDAGA